MTCSDHCGASFHTEVQIHISEPSGKANELSKGGGGGRGGGGCDESVTHPISRCTFYPICIVI